jgi:hypothetical protein
MYISKGTPNRTSFFFKFLPGMKSVFWYSTVWFSYKKPRYDNIILHTVSFIAYFIWRWHYWNNIHLTSSILPHFCARPKPWSLYSNAIYYDLFCVQWFNWEVIARFVDIGGIVDHHCLNFLFIRTKETLFCLPPKNMIMIYVYCYFSCPMCFHQQPYFLDFVRTRL